jgi:hypothetical protein
MSATLVDGKPLTIEGHKLKQYKREAKTVVAGEGLNACACGMLEIDWLPFAAERYQCSPKFADYILVEVPIVVASFPNRNMDAFPFDELTAWRTIAGRPAYKTFVGKPVHQDHDNQDDTKAKGVIFDATLRQYRDQWHVVILKGFDRSKDTRLAGLVQKKNRCGHSMGTLVERTECSLPWCRHVGDGVKTCMCLRQGAGKGEIERGHLKYELLRDFYFIESSSVEDPAAISAVSSRIWTK